MLPIRDINRPERSPVITKALVAINVAVFLLTYFRPRREFIEIVRVFGVKPAMLLNGKELYTLFTSMFLHGDIHHIFGNMLYLWIFGDNVEDRMGHGKFLAFYLLSGMAGALVQSLITPNSLVPMIGASAAISGVLGAYFVLFPWARILTLVMGMFVWLVEVPAYFYLGTWFLLQLLYGVVSLGGYPVPVAFWAHAGGFAFGALVAVAARGRLERRREYYVVWV